MPRQEISPIRKQDTPQKRSFSISGMQHPELVPGYRPKDPQLLTDVNLYLAFPDLMPEYENEVSVEAREKIKEMTTALDEKIMQDHRRKEASGFSAYVVRGIETQKGASLNLKRQRSLDGIRVEVKNIIEFRNSYPHVETEEFLVDSHGNFTMKQAERRSPESELVTEDKVVFTDAKQDFTEEMAAYYSYFYRLVLPYLNLY